MKRIINIKKTLICGKLQIILLFLKRQPYRKLFLLL